MAESTNAADARVTIADAPLQSRALESTVAELQGEVWAGEWQPPEGGNVLVPCTDDAMDDGYYFYGSWFTGEDFEHPQDEQALLTRFNGLLSALGATDVELFTSPDGSGEDGVTAQLLARGLREVTLSLHPQGFPGRGDTPAVLDVVSTCLPIDRP